MDNLARDYDPNFPDRHNPVRDSNGSADSKLARRQPWTVGSRPISRRLAVTCSGLIALFLPLFGISGAEVFWPVLLLTITFALAVTPTSSPCRTSEQLSTIGYLSVGLVMSIFISTALLLLTALASVTMTRLYSMFLWGLLVLLAWSIGFLRKGQVQTWKGDGLALLIGLLGISIGVIISLVQSFSTWGAATAGSTDFNRHVILVKKIVLNGGIDYGTIDYPQALHSIVSVLWSASGGTQYVQAWAALESITWLIIVLMLTGLVTAAVRLTRLAGSTRAGASLIAALAVVLIYSQSMWITVFFKMGFVTSILGGLVVVSIVTLGANSSGKWFGSAQSLCWLLICTAVTINNWIILAPLTGTLLVAGFVIALVKRSFVGLRWKEHAGLISVLLISGLVSIPPLRGMFSSGRAADGDISGDLATTGFSGLYAPEWWWWVGLGLSLFVLTKLWLGGIRRWPFMLTLLLFSGGLTTIFIALQSQGSFGTLNYYASKTLWSSLVVLIATTSAAIGYFTVTTYRVTGRIHHPRMRFTAKVGVLSILVLLAAAILGRMSGSPSKVWDGANNAFGSFPTQLAVASTLENIGVQENEYNDAIVWGLVPSASPEYMANGAVGYFDTVAREATGWFGITKLFETSPMQTAAIYRDPVLACEFLQSRPSALRVTGPNPAAGADWLIQAGCPTEVVQPDAWVVVPLKDWGYTYLDNAQDPLVYPTYADLLEYQGQQKESQ